MGSSHVRRQTRRLFLSAQKGARTSRWRDHRPGGLMRPLKATNRAEKSGGSKPRRKRGLRAGKARSRGCHPRRSPPERQPLPDGFSERSFKKVLGQFDFWELRIHQLRERLVNPVKDNFLYLSVDRGVGQEKVFDSRVYRRYKTWYLNLRSKILSGSKAARPLVQTEPWDGDRLFTAFLYKEFKWVPPHAGGVERYRSGILDDLVRLVRKDFVNPPPLSEKKRRAAVAKENRRERRIARGEVSRPPKKACVHSGGQICRFCGESVGPLKPKNSRRRF